jgi:hypothetical protein
MPTEACSLTTKKLTPITADLQKMILQQWQKLVGEDVAAVKNHAKLALK